MLKRIGAEEGGEFKAVASGTLPCGKPVAVNADGTVSVVSGSDASVGSAAVFESAQVGPVFSTFDSNNNKVVIFYRDYGNSNYGTAVVGTVSGSAISFGTPVVFRSTSINNNLFSYGAVFDSSNNKVVAIYSQGGNGRAVVGTVSGTSISFGSEATFDDQQGANLDIAFDSTNNKVVVVYTGTNNYVETRVGTVSGTSISFGTAVVAMSLSADQNAITFDSNRGKVVVCCRVSTKGRAAVGTVSGTGISFATNVIFADNQTKFIAPTFDSNSNKVVIAYINGSSSDQGQAVVGDIDGSGVITFGSAVTYNAEIEEQQGIAFDSNANKVIVAYDSKGTSKGQVISGTVSGTSISFDSETVFEAANVEGVSVAFDSNANKSVISYIDAGNSNYGTSVVYAPESTNITSENYIGMSRGVAFQTGSAASVGSAAVFESADTEFIAATFDSNSNKIVIAYKDSGNSGYGTAVVGTVSGNAITFGTPVVYVSGSNGAISTTFDSSSNKVIIVSLHGVIVGTVSGTSISFGSMVQLHNNYVYTYTSVTFDSNSNKVVIVWSDGNNNRYGTAQVGTVSGTSISLGSAVVFESAETNNISCTFDSNSNKVVVGYEDNANSRSGTAIVGTVSGTDITFGSPVVFRSGTSTNVSLTFDFTNNKVVIIFNHSSVGKAIVGTVSGTSISFGSEATFHNASLARNAIVYDSNIQKVVVAFENTATSDFVAFIEGTVSGTDISFGSSFTFASININYIGMAFDSNSNKPVAAYQNQSNSSYGTAIVYTPNTLATTRGQVASGQAASMDIIGSVSDNQIGLTTGQQYFVQTDGTISTTAATPSVLAGTAISATELVVKT